ncbi:MAG: thiamine pyrophosphate-binding protein [Pseudomonadota bacterium]
MSNSYERNFGQDYEQTLPTLGESMVQILQFFGAKTVYGVGGDFAANMIAALSTHLQVLPASNEMHGAFCACAQAEIEGMGFCLSTYTVGSLPCMTAAALAKTERFPVVFLSGAPGENEVHRDAIHHTVHNAFDWCEDYDAALRAFSAIGLRAQRLQGGRNRNQPNIAALRFFELVKHAYLNREPVFIEIPRDLLSSKTQPVILPTSKDELLNLPVFLSGAEAIASTIASKLQSANAPLLYIGEQVKLNDALKNKIVNFCHLHNIPFVTSWFAKGLFDEYDELCLGCYNGVFSSAKLRHYVEHNIDYVLDVGTSIFPQDTASAFHTNTHFIEQFSNKTVVKAAMQHERDLLSLFDVLETLDIPRHAFTAQDFATDTSNANDKIDFHNLSSALNQLQENDQRPYIYLPEVGNSYFASFGLRVRANALGRAWLTNPWYAAMGTSLPYARIVAERVKTQNLDARTILITGDGGFHFQLNELIHFQKQQLAVIIIYMRNNIFHLGKSGDGEIYHCSDSQFDVQLLIRAYGGKGSVCKTVGQFKHAFSEATEANQGIYLIEIPCELSEQYQCREIKLLNLYILARNGNPEAVIEWAKLVQNP